LEFVVALCKQSGCVTFPAGISKDSNQCNRASNSPKGKVENGVDDEHEAVPTLEVFLKALNE
jgi:hypothetical protein